MMNNYLIKLITMMVVLTVLSACASSKVRDLATVTSANTSLISTKLDKFAANSKKVAAQRADAISELAQLIENHNLIFDNYVTAAQVAVNLTGDQKKPNYARVITELQQLADSLSGRQVVAQNRRAEFRAEVLAGQSKLETPKAELKAIAKGLGDLAKKRKLKEHIKFLSAFYAEVQKDIDEANLQAELAAGATEAAPAAPAVPETK